MTATHTPATRPAMAFLLGPRVRLMCAAAVTLLLLGSPRALEAKPDPKPGLRLKIRVEPAPNTATLARWLQQNSRRVRLQRTERYRAMDSAIPSPAPEAPPDPRGVRARTQGTAPARTHTAATAPGSDPQPRARPADPRPDPMASLKSMLKAGRSQEPAALERALKERILKEERRREQLKGGQGEQHRDRAGQSRGGRGGK